MKTIHNVVDISEHNNPDWDFIQKNFGAVIIRIGIRGSVPWNKEYYGKIRYDFKSKDFIKECQSRNIPFSFYFFPTAITEAEAHEEGKWLVEAVKGYDLCLPVCQDSETVIQGEKGRADKLSKSDRTKFINIVNQYLCDAGIPYGVYASESWYRSKLNDGDLLKGTYRWVAQYANSCTYKGDYFMWQYGKKGGLDANNCYINFTQKTAETKPQQTVKIDARQKVCDIMTGWVGRKESNNSHRAIIDIYNKYLSTAVKQHGTLNWRMPYSAAWCATAVSAAFIQAGLGDIFPVECSCPRMIKIAQKMGIWQENDAYVPKIGDCVLYDWQDRSASGDNRGTPDHIGMVTSISGDHMTVTEGNFNDAVANRQMNINGRYIRGYVTPKFPSTVEEVAKEEVAEAAVKTSYASNGKLSKEAKFTGTVNASSLNVRTWAGTAYQKCSFSPLKRGAKVDVCDMLKAKDGSDWYYIRYNGKYGFVSAKYITH